MALALEKSAVKWTSLNPEQTELCESMARGADLLPTLLYAHSCAFEMQSINIAKVTYVCL